MVGVMNSGFAIKLLLITDECSENCGLLLELLKIQGYEVNCLKKNGQLLQHLPKHLSDMNMVLIDTASAPAGIVKNIRASNELPVVVLSEIACRDTRIECFKCGVDDFIVKPCCNKEVILRIAAIIKRYRSSVHIEECERICVDGLLLDRTEQSVQVHGKPVAVTPLEFKLLWLLMFNQGRILSKPFTYQNVLGRKYGNFDRSIDMHLSRMRKKLSKMGVAPNRLRTVHGRGYSFN